MQTDVTNQSDKKPVVTIKSVLIDSCELFCEDDKLTPVQENFHREEWLNHVQYSAKLQDLPHVSVSNGSELRDKFASGNSSQSDVPVLVYSNASSQQQSTLIPPISNLGSSTPVLNNISPSVLPSTSMVHQPVRINFICYLFKFSSIYVFDLFLIYTHYLDLNLLYLTTFTPLLSYEIEVSFMGKGLGKRILYLRFGVSHFEFSFSSPCMILFFFFYFT